MLFGSPSVVAWLNRTRFGVVAMFICEWWVVGITLVLAGVGKLLDTRGFALLLHEHGFHAYLAKFLATAIPPTEIAFGLLLVIGHGRNRIYRFTCLGFLFSAVFSAILYATGRFHGCGCFGIWEIFPSIRGTLTRNICLAIFSGFASCGPDRVNAIKLNRWQTGCIFIVGWTTAMTAGYSLAVGPIAFKSSTGRENGSPRSLLSILPADMPGDSMFFVISSECSACVNAIENIRAYKRIYPLRNVYVFLIEDNFDERLIRILETDVRVVARKDQDAEIRKYLSEVPYVPMTVRIKDGKITNFQYSIPSPYFELLQQKYD